YDGEGNLVVKVEPDGSTWRYRWAPSGLLAAVVRPDGGVVEFGYDPLARRVSNKFGGRTTRWLWDGNVPLHEWIEGGGTPAASRDAEDSSRRSLSAAADEAARVHRTVVLNEQLAQG